MRCERCGENVDQRFRFCPWCASPLRLKIVEHFRPHPLIDGEPTGLRVSRYLTGTRHVRLSIWSRDGATAAIALEEREARRLAAFLGTGGDATRRPRERRLPVSVARSLGRRRSPF